jgi:hypothetical protein
MDTTATLGGAVFAAAAAFSVWQPVTLQSAVAAKPKVTSFVFMKSSSPGATTGDRA